MRFSASPFFLALSIAVVASAATLPVGAEKPYPSPCAAVAAALPGDTIEVDPATTWVDDICTISKPGLTIRSTGAVRAAIHASGKAPLAGGKAIWLVAAPNVTIEGFEFDGAAGGSAIYADPGEGLVTVRNCFLHDNRSGLTVAEATRGEVQVEETELARNGHNLDVYAVRKLTLRFSYSHHATSGYLIRSRAAENHLLYNRLTQESGETQPLSFPDGARTYLMGNLLERSPQATGATLLRHPSGELYAVHNTFVNDGAECAFLDAGSSAAVIRNNIFHGPGRAPAEDNFTGDAEFVDTKLFDYRLRPSSPAVNAGTEVPVALQPELQYAHPLSAIPRFAVNVIDAGALEYGNADRLPTAREPAAKPSDERSALAPEAVILLLSGGAPRGKVANIDLFLFTSVTATAAAQWTLNYSTGAFTSVVVKPGPAAIAAGKSVYCTNNTGRSITCQLVGNNTSPIKNGIVATVAFELPANAVAGGTVPVSFSKAVAATAPGERIPGRAIAGNVNISR